MRPAGIEPATPSLEGWCSIQLSYRRAHHRRKMKKERFTVISDINIKALSAPPPPGSSRTARSMRPALGTRHGVFRNSNVCSAEKGPLSLSRQPVSLKYFGEIFICAGVLARGRRLKRPGLIINDESQEQTTLDTRSDAGAITFIGNSLTFGRVLLLSVVSKRYVFGWSLANGF